MPQSAAEPAAGDHLCLGTEFDGAGFDLVTVFDALHDMGDQSASRGISRKTLKPDGTFMLVEPLAGDALPENLNPVGRIYYAFSTNIFVPASLSQEVGAALARKRAKSASPRF